MAIDATIYQSPPTAVFQLALIPIGMFANKEIQECKIGSIITFQNNRRATQFRLKHRALISVKSSLFTLFSKTIYGEDTTYESLKEEWADVASTEGWGDDCFDHDNILMIEIEPLDDE